MDFNTLEKGKAAGGQQQLGSVHTPADRLVGCVNDFFELFVSSFCYHGLNLGTLKVDGCPAKCWLRSKSITATLFALAPPSSPIPRRAIPTPHHFSSPSPFCQGLGNPLFALFFLFPECERWIKWLANAWPTPNFKRVRRRPEGRGLRQLGRWVGP